MPDLEVEVQLEGHTHISILEIESILESPNIGDSLKCNRCGKIGKITRVGVPSRKPRSPRVTDEKQKSILRKE